jgi:hypothetical protein
MVVNLHTNQSMDNKPEPFCFQGKHMDVKGVVAALQKDSKMPMIPEVGISHF